MNTTMITVLLLASLVSADEDGAAQRAQVQEALQATMPGDLVVTELSIIGRKQWSPKAQLTVSWERGLSPGRRRATLLVKDGSEFFKAWAAVRIAQLRPVLAASRALSAGAQIAPGDVEVRSLAVSSRGSLELSPEALIGQSVLRDVDVGVALDSKDVTLPSPTPRGTEVVVISRFGGAQVRATGTLLKATRLGEQSKVRVPMSTHPLLGRLVSAHVFELEGSR